jgi:superkiller protein 3
MNPKRTWASLLIGLLAIQSAGCASLPGWMSASNSTSSFSGSGRSIETQLDIARIHEHQEKFTQARRMYLAILENDPENVQACHRLAVVLTRQGKQDEAISYYQRAVELDPENSEVLSDFGYALFLKGDLETAEEALQQALAIDPDHKRSIGNLAMVRGQQGNFNDCLSLFREIVPEAEAYANLAYIHVQRGEEQLAIQRYGYALELDNNLETAAEALVQIAKLQNRVPGSAPGLNNRPAPDTYVATDGNIASFATDTAEVQTESPNTETQGNRETVTSVPGQWWNLSSDLVLAGSTSETTAEAEISAEEFPADEIAADEFVPAPHPLVDTLQDDQIEAEFDDRPGVVRIGSLKDNSGDSDRY